MASSINRIIGSLYEKGKKPVKEGQSAEQKEGIETEILSVSKSTTNIFKKAYIRVKELVKNNKTEIKYLLYAIPIIAIFLLAMEAKNIQKLFLRAVTHSASVSFQLQNWSLPPANTFGVWINSDSPVAFADIELTFDPSLVKMTQEISLTNSLTRKIKVTSMADANSTGKVSIVLGLDPSMLSSPPSGAFQLANITFNANTTSQNITSKISFSDSIMQIVATDQSVFALTSTGIDLTLNPTAGASLSFSPPVPASPEHVNAPFTTDIIAGTAGQDVSGVDTVIKFDATKLHVSQIAPTNGNGFSSYPLNTYDNTAGTLSFSANIGSATSATPVNGNNIDIAKITFIPVAATSATTVSYNFTAGARNDSNIILKVTNPNQDPTDLLTTVTPLTIAINTGTAAPTPTPTATSTPTPTIAPTTPPTPTRTATPTPTPTTPPAATPTATPTATPGAQNLTLTFGFQGKSRAGVSRATSLTFSYKKDNQAVPTNLILNTNSSGQASVSLTPGNYVFLVKSPGYLARRFGTSASPIVVHSGDTAIDFSSTLLLGGDFNADGEVNEVDYTSLFLTTFGTANTLADLDGSGQVNNLDFAIMRANWSLIDDTFQ